MKRKSPPYSNPSCSLERAWRSDPENAVLPRALRAITETLLPGLYIFLGIALAVIAMMTSVYGLLIIGMALS